jgi:hypothetical protein
MLKLVQHDGFVCYSLVRSEFYTAKQLLNCYCTYCFVAALVL